MWLIGTTYGTYDLTNKEDTRARGCSVWRVFSIPFRSKYNTLFSIVP